MMTGLQYQYQLWCLALSFFTRIPVALPERIDTEMFHQSSRYFALVGTLIGSLLVLAFAIFSLVFPIGIAVILTLAVNLLLTGAFHEDGWADVWDGFGGGWGVENKLAIMKDSRLGTYGAAALVLALLLKFQTWEVIASDLTLLFYSIIMANTLSRTIATSLIYSMEYVSEDASSKAKPVTKQLSFSSLSILILTSAVVLLAGVVWQQLSWQGALSILVVCIAVRSLLTFWFNKQLSGYTGDCLGAAQIAVELMCYLTIIALGVSHV